MSKEFKKPRLQVRRPDRSCYSFMQAVGLVNDHTTSCFRYKELKAGR